MPKQIRPPADPRNGPLAAFGFELRTLRQEAGLSYTAISEKSFFSKSAVHAVDQGHQLPSATILKAFVTACGAKEQPWLDRRTRLALDQAASKDATPEKTSLRERGLPAPAPAAVSTPGEFNDGLKRLREWSGMTYRQIEKASKAGSGVRVAPSTLCGAFTRGTLPRRPLTASFLKTIGLPEPDQQAWLAAWQAIKDGQPAPAATAVLPTQKWLVEVPAGEAYEANAETFLAPLISRSDPDPDTDAQANWVIPTYLPTKEIRDWRYHQGYWQDVEPALPLPPAVARTITGRLAVFTAGHPRLALILLVTAALVLAALLLTGIAFVVLK